MQGFLFGFQRNNLHTFFMASSRHLIRLPRVDIFIRNLGLCQQIHPTVTSRVCLKASLSQVLSSHLLFQHSASNINTTRYLHTSSFLSAGHSKWHNIKHIKAANDRIKGEKSNFLAKKLQILFVKNPEKDPKLNSELANLIKWARSNNITNDVIDNTIDKQVKLRDPKNIAVFDGRGLSNTGIVIECFSLKPQHTKGILQGLVKKCGFSLAVSAQDLFDHRGVIEALLTEEEAKLVQSDSEKFTLDKYVDMAIEAEAEEVTLAMGEEGPYLQFLCGPYEIDKVSKNLQQLGLNVVSCERSYLPKVVIPVSQEFMDSLGKLSEKLDLNPDVVNYYFNVELEK